MHQMIETNSYISKMTFFSKRIIDNSILHGVLFRHADLLLRWLWIVLPRVFAKHVGHSGEVTDNCCSPFSSSLDPFTWFLNFNTCCFLQRVYRYFRGSGKEAEMKREAARGVARAAF